MWGTVNLPFFLFPHGRYRLSLISMGTSLLTMLQWQNVPWHCWVCSSSLAFDPQLDEWQQKILEYQRSQFFLHSLTFCTQLFFTEESGSRVVSMFTMKHLNTWTKRQNTWWEELVQRRIYNWVPLSYHFSIKQYDPVFSNLTSWKLNK